MFRFFSKPKFRKSEQMFKKVESELQRKIILSLLNKDKTSLGEIASDVGCTYNGAKKIIRKLIEHNIVYEDNSVFLVRENMVITKRLSWKILKDLALPVVVGVMLTIAVSVFFIYNAVFIIAGGFVVFFSQICFTMYRLLVSPDVVEVRIKK